MYAIVVHGGASRWRAGLEQPALHGVASAAGAGWRVLEVGGAGQGPLAEDAGGTVGAGALDAAGRLAAATSTGGRELKRPGRVGDSPIPGAGNIATAHAAVSATGWGELMLRFGTARAIAERIAAGAGAQQAVDGILAAMRARFTTPIGAIALGARGDVGVAHGTPAMPHAWRRLGDAQIRARLAAGSEGSATSR